jgi:hypothetical protein
MDEVKAREKMIDAVKQLLLCGVKEAYLIITERAYGELKLDKQYKGFFSTDKVPETRTSLLVDDTFTVMGMKVYIKLIEDE